MQKKGETGMHESKRGEKKGVGDRRKAGTIVLWTREKGHTKPLRKEGKLPILSQTEEKSVGGGKTHGTYKAIRRGKTYTAGWVRGFPRALKKKKKDRWGKKKKKTPEPRKRGGAAINIGGVGERHGGKNNEKRGKKLDQCTLRRSSKDKWGGVGLAEPKYGAGEKEGTK